MDMTKKLTKALIEMYWERKCLWQVRSEDYKKRDLKEKAYLEIVGYLRRNGVKDADLKLVRDKIQNLRRAMRKEKKRIDDSGGNYSPTLWYYDLLTFVNDQNEESSKSMLTEEANQLEEEQFDSHIEGLEEDQNDNSHRKPTIIITTETNKSPANPPEKLVPNALENLIPRPDEYEALGINVAAKVRRMEPTQRVYAELLIQKVLARGLLGQLSGCTEIMDLESNEIVRLGPVVSTVDPYRRVTNDCLINRSA